MKKIAIFLFCTILAIGISGCGKTETSETVSKAEYDSVVAERDSLKKQLEDTDSKINEAEKEDKWSPLKVQVYDKVLFPKDVNEHRFNDFVELKMNITNNYELDISGIQGVLEIQDMFGEMILNVDWDITEDISSQETYNMTDVGIDLNPYMATHTKIRDTEFSKLIFVYKPSKIMFSDGSSIS